MAFSSIVPEPFKKIASVEAIKNENWAKAILSDGATAAKLQCYAVTADYGDEIGTHEGFTIPGSDAYGRFKGYLGIIVSGQAELYEESALFQPVKRGNTEEEISDFQNIYHAYRPIRLLGPGSLVGDFSIVDNVLVGPGQSRPGETWKFSAGRKSFLVIGRVDEEHLGLFDHDSYVGQRRPDHFFIKRNRSEKPKTKIAFFKSDILFSEDHEFFKCLVFHAWKRAVTYRTSFNSYNFASVLEFRRLVNKKADSLLSDHTTEQVRDENGKLVTLKYFDYDRGDVARTKLLNVFSDALFDALNRPIRGEPVFARVPTELSNNCVDSLTAIGLSDANVLSAYIAPNPVGNIAGGVNDFYYPIDIHNHLINSFCRMASFAQQGASALGHSRDTDEARDAKLADGKHPPKRARYFYRDLANEALAEYVKRSPYPYAVKCVEEYSFNTRVLLLKFAVV